MHAPKTFVKNNIKEWNKDADLNTEEFMDFLLLFAKQKFMFILIKTLKKMYFSNLLNQY